MALFLIALSKSWPLLIGRTIWPIGYSVVIDKHSLILELQPVSLALCVDPNAQATSV